MLGALAAAACKSPNTQEVEKETVLSFKNQDFKNYLISLNYDKNKDGELTNFEVYEITELAIDSDIALSGSLADLLHLKKLKKFTGRFTQTKLHDNSIDLTAAKDIEIVDIQSDYTKPALYLDSHPKLKELTYTSNGSTYNGSNSLFAAVSTPALESFKLGGQMISGFESYSPLFQRASKLKSLTLHNMYSSSSNATFSVDLSSNTALEELNLTNFKNISSTTIYVHQSVKDKYDAGAFTPKADNTIKALELKTK